MRIQNSNRLESGMSVTEFVILAPVLCLCIYASLEINDRIEAKNALIFSNRLAKGLEKDPNSPRNAQIRNEVLDSYFKNQLHASSWSSNTTAPRPIPSPAATPGATPAPEDPDAKLSLREKMHGNKGGYRLLVQNKIKDRTTTEWIKEREKAMEALPAGGAFFNGVVTASSTLSRVATSLTDPMKGDSGSFSDVMSSLQKGSAPIFINDKQGTIEHTIALKLPEGTGLWSQSLNQLTEMVTHSREDLSQKSRLIAQATLYSESETGYHPSSYRTGGILGLVRGLTSQEIKHWSADRPKRKPFGLDPSVPKEGFSSACMFFYRADDGCIVTTFSYPNAYALGLNVVKAVAVVVDLVTMIFTATESSKMKEAAQLAGQKAIEAVVDTTAKEIKNTISKEVIIAVSQVEQEVQIQVREKIQNEVTKITPKLSLPTDLIEQRLVQPSGDSK